MFMHSSPNLNIQLPIIQRILTSNHFQTISIIFSLDQKQPRTLKSSKSSRIDSCCLVVIHHRQAVHQEKPRNVFQHCVAWWPGLCRQTVLLQEPKISLARMSRLADIHLPPGNFWKNSKNPEN